MTNRERCVRYTDEHQRRYDAVAALVELFQLSQMVYLEEIQRFKITEEDAQRQIERFGNPTRKLMLMHIQAVMCLDEDYAEEVRAEVEKIKQVLEIE